MGNEQTDENRTLDDLLSYSGEDNLSVAMDLDFAGKDSLTGHNTVNSLILSERAIGMYERLISSKEIPNDKLREVKVNIAFLLDRIAHCHSNLRNNDEKGDYNLRSYQAFLDVGIPVEAAFQLIRAAEAFLNMGDEKSFIRYFKKGKDLFKKYRFYPLNVWFVSNLHEKYLDLTEEDQSNPSTESQQP